MVDNNSMYPSPDIYRKNVSLMKINNAHAAHSYNMVTVNDLFSTQYTKERLFYSIFGGNKFPF